MIFLDIHRGEELGRVWELSEHNKRVNPERERSSSLRKENTDLMDH